ncbi:MAG: hypothetical protein JWO90_2902, partial [Solirubrobacterales bacterium]|nr:hypothetical protein [Solirubrobacterales bacterium]
MVAAALAGPAVAVASKGSDDGPGDDRTTPTTATTTTTTTTETSTTGTSSTPTTSTGDTGTPAPGRSAEETRRARAVAAARASVGTQKALVRVRRKGDGRRGRVTWEVRLQDAGFRWTVRLDRDYRVLRV